MGALRRGLRAELAAILDVDPYTLEDLAADSSPPSEPTSTHLANLIIRSAPHMDEARTVYEFLPILMLRLFGYSTTFGWLETVCELPSKDREALVRLVLPDGPVHAFCKQYSSTGQLNVATDMRYEFARSNLPLATSDALDGKMEVSVLAPFLEGSLQDKKDQMLYLTPLDYFYLCLVASPTQKWSFPAGQPGVKRLKRSVSLPSTRALYNQIITAYATTLKGSDRLGTESLFLPACLDYWFFPWACSDAAIGPPVAPVATAEAAACLMLALVPPAPSSLDLNVDNRGMMAGEGLEWRTQTNTSAVYRAAEVTLEHALKQYDQGGLSGSLVVYLRILAIYIAPWRSPVRSALRTHLLPKPKAKTQMTNGRAPTMAALTSTLSSINAQIASQTGSPGNASSVKESMWRQELKARQRTIDEELVRVAIVKAANRRLPSLTEGGKALVLLADATYAARLHGVWSGREGDRDRVEELRSCLFALRNQKAEAERHGAQREKNYVGLLAHAVGVRLENGGVLSGISEMVSSRGSNGVSGVSRSGGRSGSGSKKKIHDLRMSALRGSDSKEVPFLGDVWDRPLMQSENEFVVLFLYWCATRLEPHLGFVPNIRFLGRYWLFILASVVVCFSYVLARMVALL